MAAGLLLVMYVLSSGPMTAWALRHPGPGGTLVHRFYSPLHLLQFTPLGKPLQRYVWWWLGMFPPPDCGICHAGVGTEFTPSSVG